MNFSYFGIPLVANLLIILLCFQVSASSGNKRKDEFGSSVPTPPVTSGESENNTTTEFPLPVPSEKVEENAKGSSLPPTNNDASALIPRWITRRRKTKVLDRPLESQLHFQEERGSEDDENNVESVSTATSFNSPSSSFSATAADLSKNVGVVGGGGGVQAMSSNANEPIKATSQFLGQDVPVFRVTGVQKKQHLISSSVSQKRRLRTKELVRRQDFDLISLITEAPPVELTSVSPIESSLGGLTGLQGLPPLSLVQFIKLLVAVTPFMIPIVFVPLLIFTIGIFMIPVSKPNVFLDFGELRSLNNSVGKQQGSSLITTYAGSMKNFTTSVIMPRAYNLARQVADHEQCVERISCEVSNRYLHNSWNGNWRSVANKSWASRITNYLWKTHPILGRMAKSLSMNMQPGSEPRSAAENSSNNMISGRTFPENACSRYSCQPKSFLRKFWPS